MDSSTNPNAQGSEKQPSEDQAFEMAITQLRALIEDSGSIDAEVLRKFLKQTQFLHATMPLFDPTLYRDQAPMLNATTAMIQSWFEFEKAAQAFRQALLKEIALQLTNKGFRK